MPTLLIQQDLCFPPISSYTPFSEETMFSTFHLSASNYAQLNLFLMHSGKHLPMEMPMEPTHFPLDTFVEEVRPILQILAKILGMEDTTTMEKAILGMFSSILNPKHFLTYMFSGIKW